MTNQINDVIFNLTPPGRQLHDHQRPLQLLLHLGDVAEDSGKAA